MRGWYISLVVLRMLSSHPSHHHLPSLPSTLITVSAGENKSAHTNTGANLRKLEEETEDFHGTLLSEGKGTWEGGGVAGRLRGRRKGARNGRRGL